MMVMPTHQVHGEGDEDDDDDDDDDDAGPPGT